MQKENTDYLYFGLSDLMSKQVQIADMANKSPQEIEHFLIQNYLQYRGGVSVRDKEISSFLDTLKKKSVVINEWDFFWLDCARATYFVWNCLYSLHIKNNDMSSTYYHYSLNFLEANSHLKRIEIIHKFLVLNNYCLIIPNLIQFIKTIYHKVLQQKLELNFLKNMEPQLVKWLFERVTSKPFKGMNLGKNEIYLDSNMQFKVGNQIFSYFGTPVFINDEEAKLKIQSLLDMNADWAKLEIISTKTLHESQNDRIKEEISRCYTQKLYQFKKKQLKPFNTHLDQKSFEQFKKLQKHHGFNKEDMLMYLISEAASKIK